jgi:preprotein translocase subunit SecE
VRLRGENPRATDPAPRGAVGERKQMLERVRRPFRSIGRFLKDVWMELQRVVWPSHEETHAFTGVVIVSVAIIAVWIGLLDLVFTRLVGALRLYE